MATQIQTDATNHSDEQPLTTDIATDDDRPTGHASAPPTGGSWTDRCGAPATFDPTSHASMGQFDTTADQH
jgi:hypothetical protein